MGIFDEIQESDLRKIRLYAAIENLRNDEENFSDLFYSLLLFLIKYNILEK